MMFLPYLLSDFAGVGGRIKTRPEDFFVQEIPLYEPSGQGEHVYCEIQKVGMTTFEAIGKMARALDVPAREIGYAGMKDARAITRQVFSIWGVSEQQVMDLKIGDLTVQWAARHGNKLRLGHLKGNRFAIKIRDVEPSAAVSVAPAMRVLEQRGCPNYFGPQRFGRRADNDALGEALLHGNHAGLLRHLLGMPDPAIDDPETAAARQAYEDRNNELAIKLWPRRGGLERQVLSRLIKTQKPAAAVGAIDERLRRLWVSAFQSRLFNDVVARRIGSLDRVLEGDLAYKHENGACFYVEDSAAEQGRADRFEISPTGPLLGYRMSSPRGEPEAIESTVFAEHHVQADHFRVAGRHKIKGSRRPLRVQPTEVKVEGGVDDNGAYITVAFALPAGSFATSVLRELIKNDVFAESDESAGDD
ncbi:MAG TPA: tRNA pseudouridine(13) synthase TruD [Tepidisphaeraceae bacterium]|nr:tRNA pseudouridine(13) synthase TruD [Tepidisphaeraceae bacterium]